MFVVHGFHAQAGDPPNMKIRDRNTLNSRRLIETVLSMLTLVSHFKKSEAPRLGLFPSTTSVHDGDVQWHGFQPDADGMIHLSLAEFSLSN